MHPLHSLPFPAQVLDAFRITKANWSPLSSMIWLCAALALFPLGPFVALAQSDNKEKGERKPLLGPACSEKESVGSPILLSPNYHGPEMLCIARNIYGWNCGA